MCSNYCAINVIQLELWRNWTFLWTFWNIPFVPSLFCLFPSPCRPCSRCSIQAVVTIVLNSHSLVIFRFQIPNTISKQWRYVRAISHTISDFAAQTWTFLLGRQGNSVGLTKSALKYHIGGWNYVPSVIFYMWSKACSIEAGIIVLRHVPIFIGWRYVNNEVNKMMANASRMRTNNPFFYSQLKILLTHSANCASIRRPTQLHNFQSIGALQMNHQRLQCWRRKRFTKAVRGILPKNLCWRNGTVDGIIINNRVIIYEVATRLKCSKTAVIQFFFTFTISVGQSANWPTLFQSQFISGLISRRNRLLQAKIYYLIIKLVHN